MLLVLQLSTFEGALAHSILKSKLLLEDLDRGLEGALLALLGSGILRVATNRETMGAAGPVCERGEIRISGQRQEGSELQCSQVRV